MTNEERNIIIAVWGDTSLRVKLEDNPYGLTPDELRSLQVNDSLNNLLLSGVSAGVTESCRSTSELCRYCCRRKDSLTWDGT
jgi:hypothetical protein